MASRIQLLPMAHVAPKQDSSLRQRIVKRELSGILNWAVEGARRVMDRDGLAMPLAVMEATKDYIAENNLFGRFVEECCLVGEKQWVERKSFRDAFNKWIAEQDDADEEWAAKTFGVAVKRAGFRRVTMLDNAGKKFVAYNGVNLEIM